MELFPTHTKGYLPDAVNVWIGDHRSTTSVHAGKYILASYSHMGSPDEQKRTLDPYENIYTVIRGTKHFTLFPPTEGHFLAERLYPRAIYKRPSPDSPLILTPLASPHGRVRCHHDVRKDESVDMENMISWASADTSSPIPGTMAIRVSVHAGETLYLPSGTCS